MEHLSKAERKRAGNYLAVIHATGCKPRGMHLTSNWSTTVMLGAKFNMPESGPCFYTVEPDVMPLVEGHPLVASVMALRAQGFVVDTSAIKNRKRWTITDGVPMRHTEDSRTLRVDLDGSTRQLDGPDGRWAYQPLGNPGQQQVSL